MSRPRRKKLLSILVLLILFGGALFLFIKRDAVEARVDMLRQPDIMERSVKLDKEVDGTSGLLFWNGSLWTQNDNLKPFLYALDPRTGAIQRKVLVSNVRNYDWEEISQDEKYIYIGETGDNHPRLRMAPWRRTKHPLCIFRVAKDSLALGKDTVRADTILYTLEGFYDDRDSLPDHTNFDCEAFIVYGDSIYLFTKQWLDRKTTVYVLPKQKGSYMARRGPTYEVGGLITGACYFPATHTLALSGYNTDRKTYLVPFVYLLYGFEGDHFFSGTLKRVALGRPYHQVEGIATADGRHYYFTNEQLKSGFFALAPPILMEADLSKYMERDSLR